MCNQTKDLVSSLQKLLESKSNCNNYDISETHHKNQQYQNRKIPK